MDLSDKPLVLLLVECVSGIPESVVLFTNVEFAEADCIFADTSGHCIMSLNDCRL